MRGRSADGRLLVVIAHLVRLLWNSSLGFLQAQRGGCPRVLKLALRGWGGKNGGQKKGYENKKREREEGRLSQF